jgi:hypothetical protein
MAQNSPKIQFLKLLTFIIRHLVFVTLIHFIYIDTSVCGKNLGPNVSLDIHFESLELLFWLKDKVLD